jgi:hypothetical protein
MTADHPDLVDEFYRPYIRALGNLVIMFAHSEAALLSLVLRGDVEAEGAAALKQKRSGCYGAASGGLMKSISRRQIPGFPTKSANWGLQK